MSVNLNLIKDSHNFVICESNQKNKRLDIQVKELVRNKLLDQAFEVANAMSDSIQRDLAFAHISKGWPCRISLPSVVLS